MAPDQRPELELPLLRGERLTLRPAVLSDADALLALLLEPDVRAWWGAYDAHRVRRELTEIPSWAIEVDGRVSGWLHANEEPEPDYPSVAFDVLVGGRVREGGYGREALRTAIAWFAGERGHHRFTIDPAVENERAIRAYEAIGFAPVGVLHMSAGRTGAGATAC